MEDEYVLTREQAGSRLKLNALLDPVSLERLKNDCLLFFPASSITSQDAQDKGSSPSPQEGKEAQSLVVDLSDISYIDSMTTGFFAWLHRLIPHAISHVSFDPLAPHVYNTFKTVGLLEHAPGFSFAKTVLHEEEIPLSKHALRPDVDTRHTIWSRSFQPDGAALKVMRSFVDEWLERQPVTRASADDIRIIAGEVFANALTHGSCGVDDPFTEVRLERDGTRILMDVTDNGRFFDGCYEVDEDPLRQHGRGIIMMRNLAQSVSFSRPALGEGTCVHIVYEATLAQDYS